MDTKWNRSLFRPDPRDRGTRFSYDPLNRITQIVDALGRLTRFGYDGNGNLLTVTDALNHSTIHTYDNMDRLATRSDPLNRAETFSYDPSGNLTQFTDRKGQVSTFTYDALNRRIGANYADGSTTSFVYDAVGRLVQASDSVGDKIINQYDVLDQLVAQTTGLGAVSYQYDVLGRRTQMTVSSQDPATYGYDAASRLTQVVQGTQVVSLAYDPAGRRTRLTLPNGVSTEYQYDAASRVTALIYRNALGLLGDLQYSYDPAGNRVAVGGSFARALLPDPIPSTSYDAANQQLSFGGMTMTYDANGNLVSITDAAGTTTFTWDTRNRLIGLSGPNVAASFTYDAFGRRIAKQINGRLTQYLYDGDDIIQELAEGNPVSYLRSLNIDEPFVRNSSEFYLADILHSTVAVSGSTGSLTTTYTYEPFGRVAINGVAKTPFHFAGRENDTSGVYYHRARYYHPILGRFLSEDPIGLFGRDVNLYAFVYNNPLTFVDPTGEYGVAGAIVGGISGAVGGGITGFAAGGGVRGALIGAFVGGTAGALVGFVNPFASSTVGVAAGNVVAGAVGQVSGNLVHGQSPFSNFSVAAALGAGVGSFTGSGVTGTVAGLARAKVGTTITSEGITTGVWVTGSAKVASRLAEGVVDGVFVGFGELLGQFLFSPTLAEGSYARAK